MCRVRNTINSLLNVNGSVVNAFWRIQHSVPSGIIIFNNIGNKLNHAAAVRVLRNMPAGHEMKARERCTKPIIYLQRINAKSRVWSLIRITDDIFHSFREYYIQLLFRINKTWLPKNGFKNVLLRDLYYIVVRDPIEYLDTTPPDDSVIAAVSFKSAFVACLLFGYTNRYPDSSIIQWCTSG